MKRVAYNCVSGYRNYKDIWDAVISWYRTPDMKESLIQTEVIDMQSPLRDGIITGNLLCKYHEPVPYSYEATCRVIMHGFMH